MKVHVRGDHHLDVTPALRDYVEKKLGRLERYCELASEKEATVTMAVTRDMHSVEVTIPLTHFLLRAEERSPDMYASIDMVVDKLEKQLAKYKHRMAQRPGHRHRAESGRAKAGAAPADRVALAFADDELSLVRVKDVEVKPMHVDEAIMQMDLLGHDFFVFANAETDETNVVYRRRDGRFGLIQAH
jgi:putative sigma-54 modulation protein